jgi:magnesium transporter
LKNLVSDVYKESKSIKKIYLEISENERKDFYRRIECIDIFTFLIRNETSSKRRFIEFMSKNYFTDSVNDKRYFYKKSVFLMELLLAKTKQIEIQFNKIKFISEMVKENYNIILEDNSKKNKDRLNQITQIISLMSVLFMPFTFISSIFGMNIKLPFVEWDSLIPFFIVIAIMIIVFCVHIIVFKRYNFI